MFNGAGYLFARNGMTGIHGDFYDYVLAAGGLYLRAANPLIEASICIAPTEVRGLDTVDEFVRLIHGKIPMEIYNISKVIALEHPDKECYVAVTWNPHTQHYYPQILSATEATAGHVTYNTWPNTVMDIHSHGQMPAFFSGQDTADEQGFKLSLVLGKVDTAIEYKLRLGIFGYFKKLTFMEVFEK
jgi:PRTRC genetic system protein A